MIQLSKASDYALLFLTNLARRPDQSWSVGEASAALKIPRQFLANIVHRLALEGIVSTSRGKRGGVKMTRGTDSISVMEVIAPFEGSINLMPCVESACEHTAYCDARSFFHSLRRQVVESFSSTKLNELGGEV